MVKTFDTSRVGGGTYELEQDSSGNYKLKSVGFEQVNKLNLPDLTNLDAPATTTKPEEKKDIADPFKKLADQQQGGGEGGGQDYSAIEAKVKQPSAPDPIGIRERLDDRDNRSAQEIQNLQTAQQDYKDASTAYRSDFGSAADKAKMNAANETIMSAREKYRTETQYNPTSTITGLQKVKSAVSNTVKSILDNSLTVKVAKGIANAITSPEQQANNEANTTALKNNGYITDFQGKVVGRDGKAVSAVDSVFGGMNSRSGFGDISVGAANRVETRNSAKTQERISKLSPERQKAFNDKTREFEREVQQHNNDKNTAKEKSKSQKSTNPNKQSGAEDGGNDSGRVICTDLHRTGELSTRDWIRDTKFTFTTLSKKHVKGYLLWAEPTVKHMQRYPRYRKMWKHIAQHRANDIAWRLNEGKFDLLGRIYAGIGEPVCWALGNFVSDKQISKYNLTHWRRA